MRIDFYVKIFHRLPTRYVKKKSEGASAFKDGREVTESRLESSMLFGPWKYTGVGAVFSTGHS